MGFPTARLRCGGICLRKHGTHVGRVSTTVAHKRLLRVQPTLAARQIGANPTIGQLRYDAASGSASRIRPTIRSFYIPRVVSVLALSV
jgi:hypothetical protein